MDKEIREQKDMTPCDVLDYTEILLSSRVKNEYVNFIGKNIPAYEWEGVGSEKGGASGYLNFNRMVFAPMENGNYLAISVGRAKGQRNGALPVVINYDKSLTIPYNPKMYGVFRIILPKNVVDRVLEVYEPHKKERFSRNNFEKYLGSVRKKIDFTLSNLIERNNRRYNGISLFAFDGEFRGLREGFFVKKDYIFDGESLEDVLKEFDFEGSRKFFSPYKRDEGRKLSSRLADILLSPKNFMINDEITSLVPKMSDEEHEKSRGKFFSVDFNEERARRNTDEVMAGLPRN